MFNNPKLKEDFFQLASDSRNFDKDQNVGELNFTLFGSSQNYEYETLQSLHEDLQIFNTLGKSMYNGNVNTLLAFFKEKDFEKVFMLDVLSVARGAMATNKKVVANLMSDFVNTNRTSDEFIEILLKDHCQLQSSFMTMVIVPYLKGMAMKQSHEVDARNKYAVEFAKKVLPQLEKHFFCWL